VSVYSSTCKNAQTHVKISPKKDVTSIPGGCFLSSLRLLSSDAFCSKRDRWKKVTTVWHINTGHEGKRRSQNQKTWVQQKQDGGKIWGVTHTSRFCTSLNAGPSSQTSDRTVLVLHIQYGFTSYVSALLFQDTGNWSQWNLPHWRIL